MKKPFAITLTLAFLFSDTLLGKQPESLYVPATLESQRLTYRRYVDSGSFSFPLSGQIELLTPVPVRDYDALPDDLHRYSQLPPDYNYELLRWGLARLRTPATASEDYRSAEKEAREARRGAWARLRPTPPPPLKVGPAPAPQPENLNLRQRLLETLSLP